MPKAEIRTLTSLTSPPSTQRSPGRSRVKAAAEPTQSVDLPQLDSSWEPGTKKKEATAALRTLRSQEVRYELLANSGRYADGTRNVARARTAEDHTYPMHWVVLPRDQVQLFAPKDDPQAQAIRATLDRTITDPDTGEAREVTLLPVHWKEAEVLAEKHPELIIVTDGEVFPSASPRSLFFGPGDTSVPKDLRPLENYSIKTHLSAEAYERLGGLLGSRELNYNDCLMASVLSHVMEELRPKFSPLVEFQSEARTVVAKVGEGDDAVEVGAIFRELSPEPAVPGFALFSETNEWLPHVPHPENSVVDLSPSQAPANRPRILAAEAMKYAMEKNPGVTQKEAFLKLFVEPLLEVFFTMAREGVSMELHPQNFLLEFDKDTGWVKKVVIRDLHGLNYSKAYREAHGMRDEFSPEALKDAYPDISQADIDGYFNRDGELRDRYKPPAMWSNTLDFFMGTFFYQLLNSTTPEPFDARQVEDVLNGVRDTIETYAQRYDFNLNELVQPRQTLAYSQVASSGIRGKILFRRPPQPGVSNAA